MSAPGRSPTLRPAGCPRALLLSLCLAFVPTGLARAQRNVLRVDLATGGAVPALPAVAVDLDGVLTNKKHVIIVGRLAILRKTAPKSEPWRGASAS